MKREKTYMLYRVSYSAKRDSFSTWIYVGKDPYAPWEEFGMEIECQCVDAFNEETQSPTRDKGYIHYTLLSHIRRAKELGYEIRFIDKPE